MWAHVEADFRRDYGIRLPDELPRMSWREFSVLLRGLNPHGALACNYGREARSLREAGPKSPEEARAEAARFWSAASRIAAVGDV